MAKKKRNKNSNLLSTQPVPKPRYEDGDKNWDYRCDACGELPTVNPTGLCGPCCFGEAETAGGNW